MKELNIKVLTIFIVKPTITWTLTVARLQTSPAAVGGGSLNNCLHIFGPYYNQLL